MNTRMNTLLEKMHTKLRRQEGGPQKAKLRRTAEAARKPRRVREESEEAFGPESRQEYSDDSHLASKAGVGGATNVPEHNDAFDRYMSACMDALMNGFGWEEGKANGFINKVAGELESDGMLPPMPSEGGENEAEDLAVWLAAAHSVAFISELMQRAAQGA